MYVRGDVRCQDNELTYLIGHVISFLAMWGKIFTFRWVLTSAIFSLNNRDLLQERSYIDNSNAPFPMIPIRQSKAPYRSMTGSTSVAVTVHRTTAADFSTSKHNDHNEPDLEKSVRVLHYCRLRCSEIDIFMFLKLGIETSVHEVSQALAI